ncbi:MAG: hypothetical protein ACI4BC_10085 [Muribaculaceae bacterium]
MNQTTPTPTLRVKTKLQEKREARDLAIYNEYNALAANPEQSKEELNKYLMEKYGIHSTGTLYIIRKRVEERLKRNGGAK